MSGVGLKDERLFVHRSEGCDTAMFYACLGMSIFWMWDLDIDICVGHLFWFWFYVDCVCFCCCSWNSNKKESHRRRHRKRQNQRRTRQSVLKSRNGMLWLCGRGPFVQIHVLFVEITCTSLALSIKPTPQEIRNIQD